jgi:hypothetical protein
MFVQWNNYVQQSFFADKWVLIGDWKTMKKSI